MATLFSFRRRRTCSLGAPSSVPNRKTRADKFYAATRARTKHGHGRTRIGKSRLFTHRPKRAATPSGGPCLAPRRRKNQLPYIKIPTLSHVHDLTTREPGRGRTPPAAVRLRSKTRPHSPARTPAFSGGRRCSRSCPGSTSRSSAKAATAAPAARGRPARPAGRRSSAETPRTRRRRRTPARARARARPPGPRGGRGRCASSGCAACCPRFPRRRRRATRGATCFGGPPRPTAWRPCWGGEGSPVAAVVPIGGGGGDGGDASQDGSSSVAMLADGDVRTMAHKSYCTGYLEVGRVAGQCQPVRRGVKTKQRRRRRGHPIPARAALAPS